VIDHRTRGAVLRYSVAVKPDAAYFPLSAAVTATERYLSDMRLTEDIG